MIMLFIAVKVITTITIVQKTMAMIVKVKMTVP